MPEQQNIEWKRSWHDDYLKWICGFANAIGGIIYIGKDDDGKVTHLQNYKKLLEDIPNKVRNSMGIICDIQLHEEPEGNYISIKVNPYSVPVSLRGRYYYRTGSTKVELTGVELNEFLLKKAGKTWDDVIEEGATIEDIDQESVYRFVEDSKEKGRMPDTSGLTALQILDKLRLTEGSKLKRAALVLFAKDPNKFYPNIQVKIGRFGVDSSDLKFQEVIEGNLVYLLNEVQVQLNYKFLTRAVDFTGLQRIEKGEYPVGALREMLLNAMVHRNYMGAPIQLRVFDHKLSIWNEGTLPANLSFQDLRGEHNSHPRNPKIAEACFKAGYIDAWGRGIVKIINACKEAELAEPDISEKEGGFYVGLSKVIIGDDNTGGPIGGPIGSFVDRVDGKRISLTKRQHQVLTLIMSEPTITRKELAGRLEINQSAIQGHINGLKSKGVIEREGGNRGHWKILIAE
jgi:ATP-dependent DNA helicase RecG